MNAIQTQVQKPQSERMKAVSVPNPEVDELDYLLVSVDNGQAWVRVDSVISPMSDEFRVIGLCDTDGTPVLVLPYEQEIEVIQVH